MKIHNKISRVTQDSAKRSLVLETSETSVFSRLKKELPSIPKSEKRFRNFRIQCIFQIKKIVTYDSEKPSLVLETPETSVFSKFKKELPTIPKCVL